MALLTLDDVLTRTEELARTVAADEADVIDLEARWPEATFRAYQDAGLAGLVVPVEHGGLGHGLFALTRTCEIIGRVSPSAAISIGMHHLGTAVLAAKATPDQVERYLGPIARGEHVTTLALSEPGTGVHFYYPETRLARNPDGSFTVTGTKSFATNGGHADSYVVSTAAAQAGAPPGQFSCVMVGKGAAGLEWHEPYAGFGMRGNSARTFTLNDVRLPSADLLGREGDQIWYVFHVVAPFFLTAMAGTYMGIATRAVELAASHLREREYHHSGRVLSDETILQHRLGTMWARAEAARRLGLWAAQEAERGGADALPALCSAKAEVTDACVEVTNEAMTLAGGRAYRDNALLARLLRDARAGHVMAPTTDLLRTWTGRALLGIPLLGEGS